MYDFYERKKKIHHKSDACHSKCAATNVAASQTKTRLEARYGRIRRFLANISLGIPACAKRISALNDFVLLDRFKDDRRFPNET